jgi:hypothetical protein
LLADREFIGEQWIVWLNQNKIRYYIRARENFGVENPKNCHRFKAFWAFNDLKRGESKVLDPIYRLNGQLCYLSASKIIPNKVPELQIIISFNKPENALQYYKDRWQVETTFRALNINPKTKSTI